MNLQADAKSPTDSFHCHLFTIADVHVLTLDFDAEVLQIDHNGKCVYREPQCGRAIDVAHLNTYSSTCRKIDQTI